MGFRIFIISCVFSMASCVGENNPYEDRSVNGLEPVYVIFDEADVQTESPRNFIELGNLLIVDHYLLIVEKFEGVHVLDNTDPNDPIKLYFWSIPGVSQLTIRDNILYTDFGSDLLVIDITDFENIRYVKTIDDFLGISGNHLFPANHFGPFECVNPDKGIVVGWRSRTLDSPKCWRWR